jgi:hypothetical protein
MCEAIPFHNFFVFCNDEMCQCLKWNTINFKKCSHITKKLLTLLCVSYNDRFNFFASGSSVKQKKKPRRGLLRSLFCCISRQDRHDGQPKNSSPQAGGNGGLASADGRCSPSLSPNSNSGGQMYLLPPVRHQDMHRKCMVIDLDETLVHSSFKVILPLILFS